MSDKKIEILGKTFNSEEEAREYYKADLKKRLPELKEIEGFPIGEDEDILALSNPPYYTACPNPYINEFIEKHGKPYDEETDDYHREPFVGDVSEGKGHPIYNVHTYHTKVPHKAIMKYIEHYTNEGNLVLDAFSGTGMTGVAAHQLKRYAIISDLSPIASFISRNYNLPFNSLDFTQETLDIIKEVKNECQWMYQTNHKNGEKGIIEYVVWSDVLISPYNNQEFVFYDVAVEKGTGKVARIFKCPYTGGDLVKKDCQRAFAKKYDSAIGANIEQIKQIPVLIKYKFNKKSFFKKPDDDDIGIIEKIERIQIPYWFPTYRMPEGDEARRNDKFGLSHIHHLYSKRNLFILSSIHSKLNSASSYLWFTSQLINISKLNRYRPTVSFPYNPLSGTLYVSSLISEANVFVAYENKLRRFVKALQIVNKTNSIISTNSATSQLIKDNSIDYIFTDPPFGANIMYSELSFMWESWLKVLSNNSSEAIINRTQQKKLDEYHELMYQSFKEYYRTLKPKRWISVEFHNSKSSIWNTIQDSMIKAGFIISQISILDKQLSSFKQITSPGAVKSDLVISAYKPSNYFEENFLKNAGEGLELDFIQEFLHQQPIRRILERTEKMLYSKMLSYYVQHGYEVRYDAKTFYQLLRNNYAEEEGYWFNAGQINSYIEYKKKMKLEGIDEIKQGAMMMFVTDEKSALVWLHNFLNEPKSFSDIHTAFTQLANIQGDNMPDLKDLLEQNFIAEKNLFRRPQTEPEHNSVIEKREKQLMRQFESILIQAQTGKKKIKSIRKEAVQLGFETCYKEKRFQDILTLANRLDKKILEENAELKEFVDAAEIMISGLS